MATLTIPDNAVTLDNLPDITTATSSDLIPAYQATIGKLTIAKILALVISGASSGFNTLKKLEDGKLSIDGTIAMTGDLDADGNRIINQAFAGTMLNEPTVITASNPSFTYSTGCRFAMWILQGGGQGGSGANSAAAANSSAGIGGRSGSWLLGIVDVESLVTKGGAVTIGAGGAGGSGLAAGSAGGDSTYIDETNTFTAVGGSDTQVPTATSDYRAVGYATAAAQATGGLVNGFCHDGFRSNQYGTGLQATLGAHSGKGGDSLFGAGGRGITLHNTTANTIAGWPATGYGSGGGGAVSLANGGSATGGVGMQGIALLFEFY